ncbi:MAG: efflux RND transporter periplasmic adaptor subunit, partial [Muribaculaceae bacterium]|nr:efflux RND transporter periplasmic adaptor subunit [Muribaculaceae bacterium]
SRGLRDVYKRPSYLRRRNVRLGDSNSSYIEVLEGLQPGDRVVTGDMEYLVNNKSLKIKQK